MHPSAGLGEDLFHQVHGCTPTGKRSWESDLLKLLFKERRKRGNDKLNSYGKHLCKVVGGHKSWKCENSDPYHGHSV